MGEGGENKHDTNINFFLEEYGVMVNGGTFSDAVVMYIPHPLLHIMRAECLVEFNLCYYNWREYLNSNHFHRPIIIFYVCGSLRILFQWKCSWLCSSIIFFGLLEFLEAFCVKVRKLILMAHFMVKFAPFFQHLWKFMIALGNSKKCNGHGHKWTKGVSLSRSAKHE